MPNLYLEAHPRHEAVFDGFGCQVLPQGLQSGWSQLLSSPPGSTWQLRLGSLSELAFRPSPHEAHQRDGCSHQACRAVLLPFRLQIKLEIEFADLTLLPLFRYA